MLELIKADLPAKGVSVNPEQSCRPRLVTAGSFEHAFDKSLFKFVDRFVK